MADGKLRKCKECTKKDVKKHREENPGKLREYEHKRSGTPERRDQKKRYGHKWREWYPEKYQASYLTSNAIRDSRLIVGPCELKDETCSGRIEAHHDDYSKPLEVRWLCMKHHKEYHKEYPFKEREITSSDLEE